MTEEGLRFKKSGSGLMNEEGLRFKKNYYLYVIHHPKQRFDLKTLL